MNKAVFLDKDNTIVENMPYNARPDSVRLLPKAGEGLRAMQQAGFRLVVVSNQSGVARGFFSEKQLRAAAAKLQLLLLSYGVRLDGFYYCPHHPQGSVKKYARECGCRKPDPGMLLKAAKELRISLADSWMIGDILTDTEAGNRAGCRTVLIDNGGETEWNFSAVSRKPDITAGNLLEASAAVIRAGQRKEEAYG